MNIVVCVKQIPDPAAPQSFDASNNLNRSGKLILDDADTYGVEMALQLVDKAGGGEVTVVSMGSGADVAGLRNALAMGASQAVIVSDESLRGSDALSTAKVLAAVVRRNPFDLVLAATESSDGYTGTMPVQLAELLGLPSITFAKAVTVEGSTLNVSRQTEAGYDEVTATLPALVTVTAGVVEPRYASFKGIMAAKSKPLEVLTWGWRARLAPPTRARPLPRYRRPRVAKPARSTSTTETGRRRLSRSSNQSRSSRRS
jgi:electron transfer flavoprotein beta subunit